uniref:Uncharacterized protein n=1 Tax=viral metagenome TaxID=1070528 RepID=A0A6M3JW33_9ZZZZ
MKPLDYDAMQKEIKDVARKHPFRQVPNPTGTVGQLWEVDSEHISRLAIGIIKKYITEAQE